MEGNRVLVVPVEKLEVINEVGTDARLEWMRKNGWEIEEGFETLFENLQDLNGKYILIASVSPLIREYMDDYLIYKYLKPGLERIKYFGE